MLWNVILLNYTNEQTMVECWIEKATRIVPRDRRSSPGPLIPTLCPCCYAIMTFHTFPIKSLLKRCMAVFMLLLCFSSRTFANNLLSIYTNCGRAAAHRERLVSSLTQEMSDVCTAGWLVDTCFIIDQSQHLINCSWSLFGDFL